MDDLMQHYHIALQLVAAAAAQFRAGLGAPPAVEKRPGDFATECDENIEAFLRAELTKATHIPVFGEEAGGDWGTPMWVIDPIDGTANFAAGNPMCAILLSLIVDAQPVLGITSLPMLGQCFSAYGDSPLMLNNAPLPPRGHNEIAHVGFSSISSPADSLFPTWLRQHLLSDLADSYLRPRITGSVGIDLAYTAAGIFDGAFSFSPNIWDNAAGITLLRASGKLVTDHLGNPWTMQSPAVIAGNPMAHEFLLEIMQEQLKGEQPCQ
ncbi:MAG: inositol monophosphatase family protein [Corynebacterium sp.]|nr:inositol monophosphatase family protein [Corynebacterium sp.]